MGGPSGYAIFVNYTHPRGRQRFTIAHEIAHFVLHRDLIGDGVEDDALYRSKLSEWYETQANRMAADILLPAELVRESYSVYGIKSLAGLSTRFDVSGDAIRIRLRELNLAP
jgi:Zn-dependent peptidase ImmA (M78 family)